MKLDDDLDGLVRDAKRTGRGRLTAAGYLRLNLMSDGYTGWILVIVAMPGEANDALKRALHQNRDAVILTTVHLLRQALVRAGESGNFDAGVQDETERGSPAFTYRWVPE